MAKCIKITPGFLDEVRKAFEEELRSAKMSDGKISFTKSFGNVKREATVIFTELAWLKMQTLVREFDKEVAWHGIAKRGEDESKDEYYITDILIYPQEVTGATVNTDQERYQMWLMEHDDEVFNNIRMQGHSHVNMGVTPSSVDTNLYDRILDQLDDDMFYIFMIWNKRGEKTIKIYDMAKNVLFETADCTVKIQDDGTGIERFLKDAKDMVKDKPATPPSSYKYAPGAGYAGKSASYSASGYKKPENNATPVKTDKSGKNRKGRREGNKKNNHINSQIPLGGNRPPLPWEDDWRDKFLYS